MTIVNYFNEPAPVAWDVAKAIFGVDGAGALHEASALETIFQNSNGTASSVPGDPVGLVLDGSKGEPGPEMIANGTFESAEGWTLVNGSSIDNGALNFDAQVQASRPYTAVSLTASKTYLVRYRVRSYGGGAGVRVRFGVTLQNGQIRTSEGMHSEIMVATANYSSVAIEGFTGTVASIDDFSVKELPGTHLQQPVAAARPTFARMPVTGRRNLLTYTEDFTNSVWFKSGVTVTSNAGVAPDGTMSASLLTPTVADANIYQTISVPEGTNTYAVWLKSATGSSFDTRIRFFNAGRTTIQTVTVTNEWQRFHVTSSGTAGNTQVWIGGGSTFSTGEDLLIWHPQMEEGTEPTPYQRVTSAFDITEEGVPDVWYLRPDLTDDALTTVLPQAINGDIVIAGTKGTIIEPVSYPANTTFSLGPTTYTGGTPGLLNAIGDIIGMLLIDRTLSQAERDQLIAHFKSKGAKGLLVPGPELLVNGDFSHGATGWTLGTGWSIDGGVAQHAGAADYLTQAGAIAGRVYICVIDVTVANGSNFPQLYLGNTPVIASMTATGVFTYIATASAGSLGFALRGVGDCAVSSFSVRELRAQEDWA